MPALTIFTPTYNRAYCINNLYKSLVSQTNKDFIWLVVDDGSTDNTQELISNFQEEGHINIKYIRQTNGGKHVAHNTAVSLCETEYFFCVDSDDLLAINAVEVILNKFDNLKNEKILGLYMRKIKRNGKNIASLYPANITRVGIVDLYYKYDFIGDMAIIFKTKYIKGYKFPVFTEERFVSERVFYNQLNHIAPMALFEDAIYVCEYLPDGYTSNTEQLLIKNPYGSALDFLSESQYGVKFVYKMKCYSQYLALIRIFSLNKSRLQIVNKPNLLVRFVAWLVFPHYMSLFKKVRKRYE